MNLMDQYQSLNRGIEEARRDLVRLEKARDSLSSRLERVLEERDRMVHETQVARQESREWRDRMRQVMISRSNRYPLAVGRRQKARQRVQRLRQRLQRQRCDFLEESRTFRSALLRLQ